MKRLNGCVLLGAVAAVGFREPSRAFRYDSFLSTSPSTSRRSRRAFTLIEIMVVVIVIGVLATLIMPTLFGKAGKARTAVAKQKITSIETAIQLFEQDYGRFPEALEELTTVPADVSAEQASVPTLKAKDLKDPWGNDFVYRFPGNNFTYDLVSLGADGAEGGEGEAADVSNF